MTQKVGIKGQVVIPKELRERVGLHPGTEVSFAQDGDRVVVWAADSRASLEGIFNNSGMAEELLRERAAEPR